ncbi:MAG: chromate resistance protein [Magnetococcales bacterium]|nr:chromate resistance protein [Magnetococcales bacterium]
MVDIIATDHSFPATIMDSTPFLALIFSLPARNATERMRAWRALKSMGGAVLRDGVYLLPSGEERGKNLLSVAGEIQTAGGSAEVVGLLPWEARQETAFRVLFDRTPAYTALQTEMARLDPDKDDFKQLKRSARGMRRRFAEIMAIDFFPNAAQGATESALLTLEARLRNRITPDEPTRALEETLIKRDVRLYQNRTWYTRAQLWVDRISSAWLIKRFIDPHARFLWLSPGQTPPPQAIGFDLDGGEFSHSGQRVTFETLTRCFDLEGDGGIMALGGLVHALDVGGSTPEAAGVASLFKGISLRTGDDDALFSACQPLLDDLYLFFSNRDQPDV